MNKKFIFAIMLIFVLAFPTFLLLNNIKVNSDPNRFDNKAYLNYNQFLDSDIRNYMNDPSIKEIPIIIMFHDGISTDLGYELLNILSLNSLKLKYSFTYFNGVSGIIDKNEIISLVSSGFIQKIFADKQYQFEKPEVLLSNVSLNAIYDTGVEAIGADYLNTLGIEGDNIRIAILDSGIDSTHPDFNGRIIAEKSFVDGEDESDINGHGTHVAGIAAGTGQASGGLYRGIAANALIINAKCASVAGSAYTSDIIAALEWSVDTQLADIVSISLGGRFADPNDPLSIAVDQAADKGVLVTISAGNSGPDYSTIGIPAAGRRIISVGASDYDDFIADFSSRGPTLDGRVSPDLVAPGVQIIAPLASDSVFDLVSEYYLLPDPRVGGTGQYSGEFYYMTLSGTSMSAPQVAGAAALLLQAFPNLKGNPQAIKAAFMNTAIKLTSDGINEYCANIQGSGKINVTAAYNYLFAINTTTNFVPVTSILPDSFPIEPYRLLYPGQNLEVIVKFLTGEPIDISIQNTPGSVQGFLTIGNETFTTGTEWNITVQEYLEIILEFNIPLNASSGNYQGRIEIFNSTGVSLHNISISFAIQIPKARIYFDMLHNYDIEDSPFINYKKFVDQLMDSGYFVDYGENLLTYEYISNFDLIILPDIEVQLFDFEINALNKYMAEGGNVLVLGSYYPLFSSESLNQFLSTYGISYNGGYQGNIYDYQDLGLTKLFSSIDVTDINQSHPVTTGVSSYTFFAGLSLTVNSPAQILARYDGSPVLAVYDNSSIFGGRLVVFSNELMFYKERLEGNNLVLMTNTINWLLKETSTSISLSLENNFIELTGLHKEYMTIYVNENGAPLEGLINGTDIFCYLNGSIPLDVIEIGEGVYKANFSTSTSGIYKINITVIGSETVSDFAQLVIVDNIPIIISNTQQKFGSILPGVSYPSWVDISGLDEDFIISKFGESIEINVTSNFADTVLLAANSDFQPFHETTRRSITYLAENMSSGDLLNWNLTIVPNSSNFNASSYPYFLVAYNSSHGTVNPIGFQQSYFVVVGSDPEINSDENRINGVALDSLEKYDFGDGQTIPIFYYSIGTSVLLEVAGQDLEDPLQDMKGYVWILDPILYYFTGNALLIMELNYNSDTQTLANNLFLGSSVVVGPSGPIVVRQNWAYSLVFFISDTEGEIAQSQQIIIAFQENFGFFTNPFFIMFLVLIIFSLVIFLYNRRVATARRKQLEQVIPPYPIEMPGEIPTEGFRFCPHCGSRINPGDIYCLSCGEKIMQEDDLDDIWDYQEKDKSDDYEI